MTLRSVSVASDGILTPEFSKETQEYNIAVVRRSTTNLDLTVVPEDRLASVKFVVTRNGNTVKINESVAIDGGRIHLGGNNTGGASGAVGVAAPYQITATCVRNGISGEAYVFNVDYQGATES